MAETKLNGKTVLMVIPHTQFREEEFFEPKKALENQGAKVVVASTSVRMCYGMKGESAAAEIAIADAKADLDRARSEPALGWVKSRIALETGKLADLENRRSDGLAAYREAIRLRPQDARAFYHRGMVRQKRGDLAEAA